MSSVLDKDVPKWYCKAHHTFGEAMNVKNRVRQVRREHAMTQQQLASLVGVTRQTIIAIERGGYLPSVQLALRLASAFGMPVEAIFWLDGEAKEG